MLAELPGDAAEIDEKGGPVEDGRVVNPRMRRHQHDGIVAFQTLVQFHMFEPEQRNSGTNGSL